MNIFIVEVFIMARSTNIIMSIIMIGITLVIIGNVLPTGLSSIVDATLSTNLDAGVASMFTNLIPIIGIFAIIMGLLLYMKNNAD